jgi:hypothetical protein
MAPGLGRKRQLRNQPALRPTLDGRHCRLERDADHIEAQIAKLENRDHVRLVSIEHGEALHKRVFLDRASPTMSSNRTLKRNRLLRRSQKAALYNPSATLWLSILEHRAGIEPAYTGFADLRVSHFAIGA